ncbi:MAG: hypothetical protein QG608_2674 [Actinomycetota bacterium]|nr:hypothetical protein [Actinomycetota bacterium]
MIIDCDTCAVRGTACGDCPVTALIGLPPEGVSPLRTVPERAEGVAVRVQAAAGLLPLPDLLGQAQWQGEEQWPGERAPEPRRLTRVVVDLLAPAGPTGPSPWGEGSGSSIDERSCARSGGGPLAG